MSGPIGILYLNILTIIVGCSGLLTSLSMLTKGSAGAIAAGVIMLIVGVMFGLLAAADLIVLLRVSG